MSRRTLATSLTTLGAALFSGQSVGAESAATLATVEVVAQRDQQRPIAQTSYS